MKYFGIMVVAVLAFGCEGKIKPRTKVSQVNLSEACLNDPGYPGCAEYLSNLKTDFTITHIKPLVADSGETVMIYGENFSDGMLVKVNGEEVSASVISGNEASFVMPDGLTNGKVDALAQKSDKTKPFLLFAWVDVDYPLITEEAEEVCQGKKYYSITGELLEGAKVCADSILTCTADGQVGCLTNDAFKAAKMANFAATNLTSGVTVAGIAGSLDLSNLTPSNVKSGAVIAGVTGDYPSATYPLAGDTATADLPSLDASVAAASYEWFKADGTRVSGAIADAGTITPGTNNQTFSTSVYRGFTVAGDADLIASNIKDAISVFGVTGNLSGTPPNCSTDGEVGCVTIPTFKAADMANVTAGNIKAGVTIAAQAGDYPSATYPLAGNTGTTDLPSLAGTVAAGSYEWFKSDGTLVSGDIADAGTITPGATNQTFNTSVYRQFTVNGDADLVAGNIKNTIDIFGVMGDVEAESHLNCTGNAQQGCITTATYQSADLTNLSAGNIKSGVTIAGQAGDYPSATYPLANSDGTADLDFATFNAKIKSAASFEWFDQAGNRYTTSGDSDITAANIATGVNIFGADGSLVVSSDCTGDGQTGCITTSQYKSADTNAYTEWDVRKGKTVAGKVGEITFYKNMANTLLFNRTSGTAALAGLDVYDTIDDYNDGSFFPMQNPASWDQATGAIWIMDPANDVGGGGGIASDNLCSGTEACVFKDRITNLTWAKDNGTIYNWENAITQCENLIYGGYTDWRLPTQKELMQAYTDGIWSQMATNKLSLINSEHYWSSSTRSDDDNDAWRVSLGYGRIAYYPKGNNSNRVLCVR